MSDTKILQAILDGQALIRKDIVNLEQKVDSGFKSVNARLDKQGASLAYLEDEAPTIKEFGQLKRRVTKIEHKVFPSR